MVNIYTDGSAREGGAVGGIGIVIIQEDKVVKYYKNSYAHTTNNRMELIALLDALELAVNYYKPEPCTIHTDSKYCVGIYNEWIFNWAANNWCNSRNQPVENIDLVKQVYDYLTNSFVNVSVVHCCGHRGFWPNELADALATDNEKKVSRLLSDEKEIEKYKAICPAKEKF